MRHQTLETTIGWSYELLSEAEQEVFRALSVFVGGFRLAAAEAVAMTAPGTFLDSFASLLDKSLIGSVENQAGEMRFFMFESIRAFGETKLLRAGDPADLCNRHATYYFTWRSRLNRGWPARPGICPSPGWSWTTTTFEPRSTG